MDSLLTSAARLLAAGDPLGALKGVALRDDPPALALRGIAMAQLGDYPRARQLLRRAARGFGRRESLAQARCRVADAEIALAARDLSGPTQRLDEAAKALDALGDHTNALHARLVGARCQLLLGRLEAAEQWLVLVDPESPTISPSLAARAHLTRAELHLRRVRVDDATAALHHAHTAAVAAGIPALLAEIGGVRHALSAPSARLIQRGEGRLVRLAEVEHLFASGNLIIDGCRRRVQGPEGCVTLARRPVLFELVRALAEAWPNDEARDPLIQRAFQTPVANESHRARLRVEMGRLRTALRTLASIQATPRGFILIPIDAPATVVLAPPIEGPAGAILALLEDGESWSTSALTLALGSSQRTIQRMLKQLETAAAVRSVGHGRSRRWLAPALGGFTTTLLLPGALTTS
jgi:hypothetical protein